MSLPYYKRFPRDFFEGTIGMSFEVKCAYGLVLDMIYMRDGQLPDDARYIAGMLGCSVRKWNSILSDLIETGNLHCENGIISNSRADYLVEERRTYRDKKAENRSRPNKNRDVEKRARSSARVKPEPDTEPPTSVGGGAQQTLALDQRREDAAFELFVSAAKRQPQWSVPMELNKVRRAKLKARLRERGGLKGWEQIIQKCEQSQWLTGQRAGRDSQPFRLTVDYLLEPKNLLKIVEGNYDDRTPSPQHQGRGGAAQSGGRSPAEDSFDRAIAAMAGNAPRPADPAWNDGFTIEGEVATAATGSSYR